MQFLNDLKKSDISAGFISAKKDISPKNSLYSISQSLVDQQLFDFQVLIATSVIDCGVSITDSNVKHIAVASSNKTTFLQMLGRIRIEDEQQINLYIYAYTRASISQRKREYETVYKFINDYILSSSSYLTDRYLYNRYNVIFNYAPYLSNGKIEKIAENYDKLTTKYKILKQVNAPKRQFDSESHKYPNRINTIVNTNAEINLAYQLYEFF